MCDVYDLVQQLSQKFMRRYKSLDHLELIAGLKDILGAHGDLKFNRWNPELQQYGDMYMTFTRKVLAYPERVISGFGDEELLEKNHFLIQIFRIPLNDQPTLYNLLCIAIYTGLLLDNLKANDFPEGIVKAYKDLKMHNMINYVSRDDYNELLKGVPDNIEKLITDGFIDILKQ